MRLLLTLLFLCAVGLQRPWDLRGYTGSALGVVTGRLVAYGYRTMERFLGQLEAAKADGPLTDALARWTHRLWFSPAASPIPEARQLPAPPDDPFEPPSVSRTVLYVDSHRKPVYSDVRLPRGLIGRSGKILGSRTLILLHDAHGHVLLSLTTRGDAHLTSEAPRILERYAQANGQLVRAALVIDREGMSASFLFAMVLAGHTILTCLRNDQYSGLSSFSAVGPFTALTTDAQGQVVREVAAARFRLSVPGPEPLELPLQVALIRDHSWRVPLVASTSEQADWCSDLEEQAAMWWQEGWQAPPAPPVPTVPKLIPLISTDLTADVQTMVQMYTARWPCQENVIKNWLIPLGIDVNHGYAKEAVPNSEVARRQADLERRESTLQQRITRTRERLEDAIKRKLKAQRAHQAQAAAEREGQVSSDEAGWLEREARLRQASLALEREQQQLEDYCREQRLVRRRLADEAAQEQPMYELDSGKDQCMTIMKVAMTNLAMWVRERYFPTSYAQAGWRRLMPFFRLSGTVQREADHIRVQVRPFNDRALNRDLQALCRRLAERPLRLPDGRRLVFEVEPPPSSILQYHKRC